SPKAVKLPDSERNSQPAETRACRTCASGQAKLADLSRQPLDHPHEDPCVNGAEQASVDRTPGAKPDPAAPPRLKSHHRHGHTGLSTTGRYRDTKSLSLAHPQNESNGRLRDRKSTRLNSSHLVI